MQLATLLRYCDVQKEGSAFNLRYYIPHDYEIMARKYGVGLSAIMTEYDLETVCDICDGLFIPGSATDIDPKYYGGTPLNPPQEIDEYALDSKVIEHFVRKGKPIFGICGGLQALNVYFGGTLVLVDNYKDHQDEHHRHEIDITPGSFVHDVFGSEKATVNSHHGWTLGKVAPEFTVVARTSADGVIEAIECKEKHIFATQWHPEQSFHTGDPIENTMFENFIRCCEENARRR